MSKKKNSLFGDNKFLLKMRQENPVEWSLFILGHSMDTLDGNFLFDQYDAKKILKEQEGEYLIDVISKKEKGKAQGNESIMLHLLKCLIDKEDEKVVFLNRVVAKITEHAFFSEWTRPHRLAVLDVLLDKETSFFTYERFDIFLKGFERYVFGGYSSGQKGNIEMLVDSLICKRSFQLINQFCEHLNPESAIQFLSKVCALHKAPIRSYAIGVMGLFGGMNIVERLCLLSSTDPLDVRALDLSIKEINKRGIDLAHLTPEGFEFLIEALLIKQGYTEIEKTPLNKDGGIDILAREKDTDTLCLIQCKRYQTSKQVSEKDLSDLDKSVFIKQNRNEIKNVKAIFITTAVARAKDAESYLEKRPSLWPFEYVDGVDLQKRLDKYFGEGRFFARKPIGRKNAINLDLFDGE